MTLVTVADESRKKTADGVARSPSRLCSRDGNISCYGDALSTIFLLAFVPCFLLFVFRFSFIFLFFFPASRFVYLLRVPSSVQQPSATLSKYVFCSTCFFCSLVCTLSHLGILFFFFIRLLFFVVRVAVISRVTFFLFSRTRYAST